MKAILLIRVSTEAQDLVQQREQVVDAAKRDGYDELILIEDKESAVKLSEEERNGLNRLKETIEHDSSVNVVYAYEISRISRRPDVVFSIRNFLIEHHVQLIILNPYFKMLKDDGTLSETSNIFFGIFASIAENEGYIRKARLKRGVAKKKAMGYHAGGQVMFGYKTVKTENGYKYVLDHNEAPIVVRIFNDYVNGKSMRLLTRDLQEEGYFKGIKYLTAVQEVYNILHRDCYCGKRKGMPAIVSVAQYEKSVQMRENNILKINHTDNMALLKGLLRDGNSGLLLSSNTAAKNYYSKRQSGISVGMHIIEPVVWEYAVKLHKQYMSMDRDEAMFMIGKKIQSCTMRKTNINKLIDEIQTKRDLIEERLINGRLSEAKAEQMHENLDNEYRDLKRRLDDLESEMENLMNESNQAIRINNGMTDYNTDDKKERYDIVHTVLEKIILNRESRYILTINIHNKINEDVKTIKIDTYKKKIISK